jgi:hypothetical protein
MREEPWVNAAGARDIGVAEIDAAVRVLWHVWVLALGIAILIGAAQLLIRT